MTQKAARRTEMPRDYVVDVAPQSDYGPHHLHLESELHVDRFAPCNVTACARPMYRQQAYLICLLDPTRATWSQEQILQSQIDGAWERRPSELTPGEWLEWVAEMRPAHAQQPRLQGPRWACPAHGPGEIVSLTSRRGREYLACARCEEFER